MKYSLLLLSLLFQLNLFSQNQMTIDSLQIKLEHTKEDSSKVSILLSLSDNYIRTDILKSLGYTKEAVEISKSIQNELLQTRSLLKEGACLITLGKYDEALTALLEALRITQSKKFYYEELITLTSLGIIQDRIGRYDEALKYYFDALNIYNKSLEKASNLKIFKNIQGLFNNIGNIYLSKKDYVTAESYYQKGLSLSEEKGDLINIGIICNNLGKLEGERRNLTKSYEYLIKSLEARKKANDKAGVAKSYYFLSSYYIDIKQFKDAEYYAEQAYDLGTHLKEPLTRQNSMMFLYMVNKALGKNDKALEYHERFKEISDSLINDNKIQEITKIQFQYEYEKQEQVKEAKQQRTRYTYIITLSTLILGLIILGLLYILTQSRNKRIILEKDKLEKDMLIKNKELTTNVMYMLQKNELISSISHRLLSLKAKLNDENKEHIQRIIFDLQSGTDKEVWEEFEYRFQNVHEDFYKKLQEKFPDLTPAEIKLAAFLRLNMTTKDIASITGQSVDSLITARYRLRKKLGITNQEVNLVNFLLNI